MSTTRRRRRQMRRPSATTTDDSTPTTNPCARRKLEANPTSMSWRWFQISTIFPSLNRKTLTIGIGFRPPSIESFMSHVRGWYCHCQRVAHEIALGNLKVHVPAHRAFFPEKIGDVFLFLCGLAKRLAIADVVDDVV